LLDYYLSSRKVTTLSELKQLLVSDRVKMSLPEGPLNHLIRLESTLAKKYATPDKAAEIFDTYYYNYDSSDHRRASALSAAARRNVGQKPGNITSNISPSASSSINTNQLQSKDSVSAKQFNAVKLDNTKTVSGKSCFKCNATDHLIKDCPQRTGTRPQFQRSFNGHK